MKDEEILKTLINFELNNVNQERELFKHIAILSSAIVGIFAFNGNLNLNDQVLYGVIGLFVVIILSVVMLFVIIRIERDQVKKARESVLRIKEIRNNAIIDAFKSFFSQKNFDIVQEVWREKDLTKFVASATPAALEFYKYITAGDEKINNEKLKNKKGNGLNIIFTIIAVISLVIFVASLIFILIGVLK